MFTNSDQLRSSFARWFGTLYESVFCRIRGRKTEEKKYEDPKETKSMAMASQQCDDIDDDDDDDYGGDDKDDNNSDDGADGGDNDKDKDVTSMEIIRNFVKLLTDTDGECRL